GARGAPRPLQARRIPGPPRRAAPPRRGARGPRTRPRRMTSVRWWGWLEPRRMYPLAPAAIARLGDELDGPLPLTPPVALDAVDLPATALPEGFERRLREISPVSTERLARIRHAAGKGYADLV